jgi:acyl-CoA synthetase (AMP-forming)/AMP-acid ligase II
MAFTCCKISALMVGLNGRLKAPAIAAIHQGATPARERLARFKCPTSVAFTDALPRNPSCQLKRELHRLYGKGLDRALH